MKWYILLYITIFVRWIVKEVCSMQQNQFVSFLEQYNVLSPNHSKIYDEYMNKDTGFSFSVETKISNHLKQIFENTPHSVIITGNAGDGKTHLCRIIHDTYAKENLISWPREGILDIAYSGGTIRIVKDLSELQDSVIFRELKQLQTFIENNHSENIYYLIAANEGKLTKFLSKYNEELNILKELVSKRFYSYEENVKPLSLINLLDVTTSIYVDRLLELWNKGDKWEICSSCEKKNDCIIYLNHTRISQERIRDRIVEHYRLLDYLGEHITMREMIIHMAYVITGGLTCRDILNSDYKRYVEFSQKIYYENLFGFHAPEEALTKMRALKVFRAFDPGDCSISAIDDFIINGDMNIDEGLKEEHHFLFDNKDMDLLKNNFKVGLYMYRSQELNDSDDFINRWIKKLRRKLFFESKHSEISQRRLEMLPYRFLTDYQDIVEGGEKHKNRLSIKRELIKGFNNLFSKKIVDDKENVLYAVNENLMVNGKYDIPMLEIFIEEKREDIDRIPSLLEISVGPNIRLKMNLSVFEYVLRLSGGSLLNSSEQDVEILLNNFKNGLIKQSNTPDYMLELLNLNQETGTYTSHQIFFD